jgi:phage gpG-like protein
MMSNINATRFSAVMRDLARVQSRITARVAVQLRKQIISQMDQSKTPEGKAWPRRADGSRSILFKTGAGRESIKVTPNSGAGIRIVVGVLYMIYHQFGGASHLRGPGGSYAKRKKNKNFGRDKDRSSGRGNPPQRKFIPFEKLPRAWDLLILAAVKAEAAKRLPRG